jgi:hypothetical protein
VADVAVADAATGYTEPSAATLAQPTRAARIILDTGVLNFSTIQFLTMSGPRWHAIFYCKCLRGGVVHNHGNPGNAETLGGDRLHFIGPHPEAQ